MTGARRHRPHRPGRVDPRIAARRAKVAGAERVRRKRWLQALAAVLVTALVVLAVVRSPVLEVRRVEVETGERVPVAQAIAVSGLRTEVPMVSVDVGEAARRLARLPWVKSAAVSRRWPGTLSVKLTERRAVAQVAGSGSIWFVVDRSGRLLDQYQAAVPGLVRLAAGPVPGPVGAALGSEWSDALTTAAGIPPAMQDRLVSLSGRGNDLAVALAEGGSVRLCGPGNLADKVLAINTLLANVDAGTIGVIDVCAPTAPVLTVRPNSV